MRIYYHDTEYESGKHKIVKVWSVYFDIPMPEDSPRTAINVPYSVLELDERHNRWLAKQLLQNKRSSPIGTPLSDRYYIDNNGDLRDESDALVTINPNPSKEEWALSELHGLTYQQLEDYIINNVTDLPSARTFLIKLSKVVLMLTKFTELEEE